MKRLTNAEKAELHKQLEEAEKAKFKPYENKIATLEKENAELKKKCYKKAVKDYCKVETQLTKAKELLAKWVELFKPKLEGYPITPIQEQTEQFLSEVEK